MSNKLFTEKEIEILSNNPNVKKISAKGITYTDEFKRIFIAEHEDYKLKNMISHLCKITGVSRFDTLKMKHT